jgi:hypothetical protein
VTAQPQEQRIALRGLNKDELSIKDPELKFESPR